MESGAYYGIDFGTTNTSVYLYNYEQGRGSIEAGYGTGGEDRTPFSSCIAISKTIENDFKFGREVKERINEYADDYKIITSFKSLLGTDKEIVVNDERYKGKELVALFLNDVKQTVKVTTDVGQHQMWAAQFYKYSMPRTLLTSGGLGTMGYGLGACIGAKMGRPDKICINIAGDGCFRMNMNELATASRYNIPIIQVVINNHVLGMVRQWQTLFYGKRYSQTVLNDGVDFCKVAEGLGCEAIRVTKKEEVAPAIEKAIAMKKPVLLDCIIPEDDKVFPMVPAGAPISEAFDAEDLAKANG